MRQILARKHQTGWAIGAFDRRAPRRRGFDRVAGAPYVVVRDVAQRGEMFDRLMGGAVFAQADGIMGVDVYRACARQRAHPHGVTRIVAEHQKGRVVRQKTAVQGKAVADRGHREFAHAEINVIRVGVCAGDRFAAFPQGQIGMREIRGAADQLGQMRREGFDRHLRSLARCDHRTFGLQFGNVRIGDAGEIRRQVAARASSEFFGQLGILRSVAVEDLVPAMLARAAGGAGQPTVADVLRDLERCVPPVQSGAGGGGFVLAQRRAVRGFFAGLRGRTETDRGAAAEQHRLVGRAHRGVDGGFDLDRIVAIDIAHHGPAVGFEARRRIVGEPALHLTVDGDVVVVPEGDEFVEAPRTGPRRGFVRDAFH